MFVDWTVAELSAAASEDTPGEDCRAVKAITDPVPCVQWAAAQEVG